MSIVLYYVHIDCSKLFAEGNYNDDINNNNNENSIILTYMLRERFEYRDYFTVNYATM